MSCSNDTQFLSAADARQCGRNSSVIFSEICAIQQAILTAIDNKKFEVVISDNTPMTAVNEVLSVTVTNPGVNYSLFAASATVDHPNGIGAIIEPIITAGTVTGFDITAGGTGYEPIAVLANATALGNGLAEIQVISLDGAITAANIVLPGLNYLQGSTLPLIHPNGVNGVVTIANVDLNGAITELVITNAGSGYETIVGDIIVTHPEGAGFAAIPITTAGEVTGVAILDGGLGYATLSPTAVVEGVGTGAILDVTMAGGNITAIDVLEGGSGYDNTTTVVISDAPGGPGVDATALAAVDTLEYNSVAYHNVWMGQETSVEITDQLDTVKKYFQKLGYNIRIEANTITSNTIQWHIFW